MKQREKERGGEGEKERERDTERLEAQVGDFRESRAVSFSRSEREEERTSIRERERKKQATREETRARAENLFLECLCDFVRIIITSKREKGLRGAVAVVVVARYGRKISMSSACSIRDRTKEQPCRS